MVSGIRQPQAELLGSVAVPKAFDRHIPRIRGEPNSSLAVRSCTHSPPHIAHALRILRSSH